MNDKVFLDRLVSITTVYNDQRMHTNFQEEELLKFLAWIHKEYGYEYEKPVARHRNEPHKIGI